MFIKQQGIQVLALKTLIIVLSIALVLVLIWGILSLIQTPAPTIHTVPVATAIVLGKTPDPHWTPPPTRGDEQATREALIDRQATLILSPLPTPPVPTEPNHASAIGIWILLMSTLVVLIVAAILALRKTTTISK